jgi:diadenosine tetraphosphate (Ap4A) HIT family hydrolase
VPKRAVFRCELCGTSAEDRAIEVDHIVPRNAGGSDDLSNLQALCYSCYAMKRDRDTTDFRGMGARYRVRREDCSFCDMDRSRILAENELVVAMKDAHPSRKGHSLLIPRRHVTSPNDLYQPEINAMWALSTKLREHLAAADHSISGFNFGSNDGRSAEQTVLHPHSHLVPRRDGDIEKSTRRSAGHHPEPAKLLAQQQLARRPKRRLVGGSEA